MENDNIIDLEDYKKQRKEDREAYYKTLSVPTLKAFEPDCYYINPEKGTMIHVLFLTDKSHSHHDEEVYVMEDQYGNFFADVVEEETCEGWHLLHKDVFLRAVEDNIPPDAPGPMVG